MFGIVWLLIWASSSFATELIFVSSKSAHLEVYFVKGTAAEKDLTQIIANREAAYGVITKVLGVAPPEKLSVYLYPTRESTKGGHGTGTAFNDGSGVSVNYFDFVPSYERTRYGHELTHAISYQLAGEHHELPLLAEGLAEFLDQSGRNMHEVVASCVRIYGKRPQLRIEPSGDFNYSNFKSGKCSYEKSGSFVKFLVDSFGWEKFRKFYTATATIPHDLPTKRLAGFEKQIRASYATTLEYLETKWNDAVSAHDKGPLRLKKADERAIRDLFATQDLAAASQKSQAIADTYDFHAASSINGYRNNLKYFTDQLKRTEISEIYDLGIKNGPSALVLVTRHFEDGSKHRITYRLEKMESGWKINEGDFNILDAKRTSRKSRWAETMSDYGNGKLPRLKTRDENAIRKIFSVQDSAAASQNVGVIENTYAPAARQQIALFIGNLAYYAKQLDRTEVLAIYALGTRNGVSAGTLTLRHFKDGRRFRIRYRLEKLKSIWKIVDEEWFQ